MILFGGANRQDVSKGPRRASSAWQERGLCWTMEKAGTIESRLQKSKTLNLQKLRIHLGNVGMLIFIIQIFSTTVFFKYYIT